MMSSPARDRPESAAHALIGADKVRGTPVFDRSGARLGEIHEVMLHKTTGRVAYAVLATGGFQGAGERYHPLPWSLLSYEPERGGYVLPIERDRLDGAPAMGAAELGAGDDGWRDRVHEHFDAAPYWSANVGSTSPE